MEAKSDAFHVNILDFNLESSHFLGRQRLHAMLLIKNVNTCRYLWRYYIIQWLNKVFFLHLLRVFVRSRGEFRILLLHVIMFEEIPNLHISIRPNQSIFSFDFPRVF